MTEEQEEKMIKAAHKYWADESGSYGKEDIMVDAFVEGYKQAFALHNVVGQSKQLLAVAEYVYNYFDDSSSKTAKDYLQDFLSQ